MIDSNFIKTIIENDLKEKKHNLIITRFPPEPNGYMHIGHARAVIVNFELAKLFNGKTYLRFDDTNPTNENMLYVNNMIEDIKWLGYEPADIFFASDYFDFMFEKAVLLIKKGLAYVDDSTAEEISKQRGDINTPGVKNQYRDRTIEENLKLFYEMKEGKYLPGEKVLRAKIDLSSPNMNMRDPAIYRISDEVHYRLDNKWKIYPLYDFAHPLEDSKEGITHSLCSLEFEDHRPLYDWVVNNCDIEKKPRQIEFGRLNIENMVMSKRYLKALVENNLVMGWDDPRMPTVKGLRRKGYTKEAIRNFILGTGLSKVNSEVEIQMLESFVREDLKDKTERTFVVTNPLKVVITNYENNEPEILKASLNPDLNLEERDIYFGKEIYIERDDFLPEKPNKHFKRLYIGGEVRLMHAYFIKANSYDIDENGNITCVYATYDKATKSGTNFNERKPNGTIGFVEASTAIKAKFLYPKNLIDNTVDSNNLLDKFNKNSLEIKLGFAENYLKNSVPEKKYQFVRLGYYNTDYTSKEDELVFIETAGLKSSYK